MFRRALNNTLVMLRQWWDSDYHPEGLEVVQAKEDKLDVKRTMPFILLHVACLLVFTVAWNWWVFSAAVLFYFFRMFAITAFYHRYFSHRAFSTSRPAQFAFAVIGNMAMQRGALWWASTHRHHHKHSDDEHDIHSPRHKGFWWSHIGWITSHRNFPTDYTRIKDLAKFPELVFLNRHDFFIPMFVLSGCWFSGWLLQTFVPSMGITGAQVAIWCGVVSTVALMHGTFFINSLAHVFGKRRFKTTDDSRNSLLLAMITLGEGWHNNHHRYQYSARQGFYWWEIDISYAILKMLSWMGIVWDLQPVPARIYDEAKRLRSEGPGH
ncbi:MAG: acyl-CoA desaturase [Verrucomicrobiaceae bacterium]|nr:acyl-CoA desaturase [Verrucomicrobiaceae bacterium]